MSEGAPRVLLLGGDTFWNEGDRAIRAALTDLLREAVPGVEILTFSRQPDLDHEHFGVRTVAPTLSKLALASRLAGVKVALWGGGHLLQDDSSAVKNPYWALHLALIRRRQRVPIQAVGLGLGPISTALGRGSARMALRQLSGLLARDAEAVRLVRSLAPNVPVEEVPDPAVFLTPSPPDVARAALAEAGLPSAGKELRIGIGLRRWFHIRRNIVPHRWRQAMGRNRTVPGQADFEASLEAMASALNRLNARIPCRFVFFPMCPAPWEGDDSVSRDLAARLDAPSHVLDLHGQDPRRVKAMAGEMDLFVGVRLHSMLLAMGMGVPCLALAYAAKSGSFFRATGQADRLLDMARLREPSGAEAFADMVERAADHREAIRGHLAKVWEGFAPGRARYVSRFRAWLD